MIRHRPMMRRPQHMAGVIDDLLAVPGQVLDQQRAALAQTATGVANQAIAAGVAKAQQAIDQTSRTTIKNAIVAALLVAAVIGAAKIAWGYANK